MPYIKDSMRWLMKPTAEGNSLTAGELNYQISSVIWDFYKRSDRGYTNVNEVVGALECAKLEFYRRVAAPYEDEKIKENGDVYV